MAPFRIVYGVYIARIVGHTFWDSGASTPQSAHLKSLDTLLFRLALGNQIIWSLLFFDLHSFLWFRRPTVAYRWAVCFASVATTLPSLCVQLRIIFLEPKTGQFRKSGTTSSILLLALFLATCILYIRLVRRFLLNEENDPHYEPTRPPLPEAEPPAFALEPLSDSSDRPPSNESSGHLSTAYKSQQPAIPSPTHDGSDADRQDHGSRALEAGHTSDPRSSGSSSEPLGGEPLAPLRCRTIARFDYVHEGEVGPDSWPFHPVIPVVLGVYNIVLSCMVLSLIVENAYAKLPSP